MRQLLFFFVAISLAGCSGGNASVYGTVTLDGQPIREGTVTFHPVAGGPVGYGVTDESGRYSLATGTESGVAPGEYVVTVVAVGVVADKKNAEPIPRPLTPEKYRERDKSVLRTKVDVGSNRVDWKLEGGLK